MISGSDSRPRTRSSQSSAEGSTVSASSATTPSFHNLTRYPTATMPSAVRPMLYTSGPPPGVRLNNPPGPSWDPHNIAKIWGNDPSAGTPSPATSPNARQGPFPNLDSSLTQSFPNSTLSHSPVSARDAQNIAFARNVPLRHARGQALRSDTASSLSGGTEHSPSPELLMGSQDGWNDRMMMAPLGRHITTLSMNGAYAVVKFKLDRAEVYRFGQSWNEPVSTSSMVIVDADRGIDLGEVIVIVGSLNEAREIKKTACKRHYERLVRDADSSRHTPQALIDEAFELYYEEHCEPPHGHGFGGSEMQHAPRYILRCATPQEVESLKAKGGPEAKALRTARKKVQEYGLDSFEIVEAEYQFDYGKLTYYFSSRVWQHFNRMIVDLFKTYKTRIWLTALNPVTFRRSLPQQEHLPQQYHMNNGMPPPPPYLQNTMPPPVPSGVPSIWTLDPLSPQRARPVRPVAFNPFAEGSYPSLNVHAPSFAPLQGLGFSMDDELNNRFQGVLNFEE